MIDRWVLLVYRLPRDPSTPRIALWRRLRALGAAQVADGVAALPENRDTRERLEWLAESVIESGGDASVWIGAPASPSDGMPLERAMEQLRAEEYMAIANAARDARQEPEAARRRELRRLRAELRRVRARDYTGSPAAGDAEAAIDQLAALSEVQA